MNLIKSQGWRFGFNKAKGGYRLASLLERRSLASLPERRNPLDEKRKIIVKDASKKKPLSPTLSLASTDLSERPRIVVLGTGWAGFNFINKVDRDRYETVVISPSNHFVFTPLLPSSAVGTLEFRAICEPIRTVRKLGGFYQAKAIEVDWKARQILCKDIFKQEEFYVPYDYLVIASGCKTNTFGIKGIAEKEGEEVFFLKHVWHSRQIRHRILECFERAAIHLTDDEERERLLSFMVVGGGPTGIEFIGELHDFLVDDVSRFYPELRDHIKLTLVEAGDHLLGTFDQNLVSYVEKNFTGRNIDVRLKTAVIELDDDNNAHLSDGTKLPIGLMVWATGNKQINFVENLDVNKEKNSGRILVNDRLLVDTYDKTDKRVYALGDCSINLNEPLPQLAQTARTQAIYLAKAFNKAPNAEKEGIENSPEGGSLVIPKKPYKFFNLGSMAQIGSFTGVVDFTQVGDKSKKTYNLGGLAGLLSFVIWRTAYLGRQTSMANKILIPVYWFKSWLLGRDISRF